MPTANNVIQNPQQKHNRTAQTGIQHMKQKEQKNYYSYQQEICNDMV